MSTTTCLKHKLIELSDLLDTDDVSISDVSDKRGGGCATSMHTSTVGATGGSAAAVLGPVGSIMWGSGAVQVQEPPHSRNHLVMESTSLVDKVCPPSMTVSSMSAIDTDKLLMGAPNNCRVTGKVDFSGTNMLVKNGDELTLDTKQMKLKNNSNSNQLFDQSDHDTSALLANFNNTSSNCHHLFNGGGGTNSKKLPPVGMELPCAPGVGAAGQPMGGAEVCHGCGKDIVDKYLLSVNGFAWHQTCLKCAACSIPLNNQASCYVTKDNNVYCKADYLRFFGVKCAKCSRVVSATDWVRRAKQLVYHLACFACNVCHRQLSTGEEFALHECHVLCKQHYLELLEIPPPSSVTSHGGRGANGVGYGSNTGGAGATGMGGGGKGDGGNCGDSSSPNTDSQEDGGDMDTNMGSPHKSKRSRTTFSEEQLKVLQANFNLDSNPDGQDLERIAQQTGLSKRVIQVWFQNARSRQKKHLSTSGVANGTPGVPGGANCANPNNIYNTAAAKMHPHVISFGPNCDELSPNASVALM